MMRVGPEYGDAVGRGKAGRVPYLPGGDRRLTTKGASGKETTELISADKE